MANRLQILVIDDDDAQVRLLANVVGRTFGGRVDMTAMTDAAEALRWIENCPPDVVLSDLDMPGVSGLDLLRAAKSRKLEAQVILVTGVSSPTFLREAIESGAADYLLKPLDPCALVAVIEQAIERIGRWRQALVGSSSAAACSPQSAPAVALHQVAPA